MSKINILDESVFNKISAGEVVEKPASVVKELLDNSIDAGASKIIVKISLGGTKNITVTDNGSGIESDDFDKVFVAHATSKLKTAEDLSKIGTLGFRGEALASIASVAKVELKSKTKEQTFASQVKIEGGKQFDVTQAGGDTGTTISVNDLFFNVPARAKFLRKPKTEASDITNLIERYILCNPHISFEYIDDDKTIYQSTGTNLFDAIYFVYGKDATNGITKVDYNSSSSGIKITGYIGLPTFSKPNRTYQTLSINGRYITSNLVSTCIFSAYEHYLMKGQFPFYVLNIQIPCEKLDVNVHPNKMEVRFGNSNEIYGNVYNAVNSTLYNCDKITSASDFITNYKEVKGGSSFVLHSTENTDENTTTQTKSIKIDVEPSSTHNFFNQITNLSNMESSTGEMKQPESPILSKVISSRLEQTMLNDGEERKSEIIDSPSKTQEFFDNSDIKFVGTVFATYLIVEKQNKVYVIDEHAGHERLLFDNLVKQVDSQIIAKQNLLVPFNLNVNRQEFDFLEQTIPNLKSIGFEIEQFGNLSFIVSAVPSILNDIDLSQFFANLLGDLTAIKSLKNSDLITRKLMQHSCKCAVRAGKILSSGEVNSLISQMKEENMQLQCPHGRPVVLEITKQDLEKLFKRIA